MENTESATVYSPLRNESILTQLFSAAFYSWTQRLVDLNEINQNSNVSISKPCCTFIQNRERTVETYSDLYKEFLGVEEIAPESEYELFWPEIDNTSILYQKLYNTKKIRFGYCPLVANHNPHKPYGYYTQEYNDCSIKEPVRQCPPEDGSDAVVGFEFKIGNIIVDIIADHYGINGLMAEWVEINGHPVESPDDNGFMFDWLNRSLQLVSENHNNDGIASIDIAFNGIIDNIMRPKEFDVLNVTSSNPTFFFYTGVIYTGHESKTYAEDIENLIANTKLSDMDKYLNLVQFIADRPEIVVGGTSPGPSFDSADFLCRQATALNGVTRSAAVEIEVENVFDALNGDYEIKAHFLCVDGIILGNYSTEPDSCGTNLNFNVRFKGMKADPMIPLEDLVADTNFMVPFTLL